MIAWLDGLLGRVTRSLLTAGCLVALLVVALVESLIGLVPVDPVAVLASTAVLVAVVLLTDFVLGRLLRIRPYLLSGIITALLMAFALQPTLDPIGLAGIAVAGLIAAASKFLFAVRGRHLLNPAAIGLLVVGTVGWALPTWWVGALPMLPFAAVAGVLVVARTRHAIPALAYFITASVAAFLAFVGFGADAASAAQFALVSSPFLFVGAFMATEPLTLAPRRLGRIVVGVVAGLLSAIPFSLGTLSASPELGLVVGSALAFLLGQRRGIRLRFLGRRFVTPTIVELRFRPEHAVRFRAGQSLELDLPHARPDARGRRRVFSIASRPADPELVVAYRRPASPSSFKRALDSLEAGDRIAATSVGGDFVLPRGERRVLFVASGVGITPFLAQLGDLAADGRAADSELVITVSRAVELPYRAELEAAGCGVGVICPEDPGPLRDGWRWLGPELTASVVADAVPDLRERFVLLSGPPVAIARLERELHRAGVRRVRTDAFLGS
jgi:ferredoxin-NADP reductase/Na+-translocating ferredoxin:NAD+ oxidoreductase RnfD subunit